jgi:oligosaccharide repeat unit polymerase
MDPGSSHVSLLNPAFLYAATWTFVLLIYSLRLSNLLDPLHPSTVVLVVGTSLSFILGWLIESLPSYGRLAGAKIDTGLLGEAIGSSRLGRRVRTLWIIFAVGISCEIVYFGGAPILSVAGIGAQMTYSDFGIPGFHGVMNALFYAGCVVTFARILLGSSRRTFLLTLISIAYPVLTMSRQVLISLLLQYALIYFSIRRVSAKAVLRAGVLFVATMLIFGYLGDVRSGRDRIIGLASPTFDYPDWLPSAFIWIYIYLSTPLSNVNLNIDISPNYLPLETAGSFIPSFAREDFLSSFGDTQQWNLASSSFNVSSLLQSFLTDFGVGGSIVFTLLCGVVFARLRRRSVASPTAFFAVIVVLHGIALSFFTNLLFHLVFMFEIFAITCVVGRARKQ